MAQAATKEARIDIRITKKQKAFINAVLLCKGRK